MPPLTIRRKKVAIVGSGSAGIGALWALNRTHHDVYLYEAADRLGGHTNTVEYRNGKYKTLVDTGFIVLNTATYRMFHVPIANIKLIMGSQLHCILKSHRGPNSPYGDDIRRIARQGFIRMGWDIFIRSIRPEMEHTFATDVENDL